jgi:hypothetical protein
MTGHHAWALRADRRQLPWARLRAELLGLAQTLEGLRVELIPEDRYMEQPDGGAFRDFGPVATLHSDELGVLEAAAEELLLEFGFLIDLQDAHEA